MGGDQNLPPGEPPSGTTPQLEMSHVLSAILATAWRPARCLDVSHIKTEFSSCCQNTFALVVYPLVTMPESAREGKYER